MSDLDEEKKRAEITKLQAETRKLDREATNSVPQARIAYAAEVAKLVGAVILGIGGVAVAIYKTDEAKTIVSAAKSDLAETTQKLKEVEEKRVVSEAKLKQADSDVAQLEGAAGDLKKKIAELELKRKSLEGSKDQPRLVFVRFRGDLRRESINDYSAFLATKAFDAPGPLRIAGSYGNKVRYFQAADSEIAKNLADETRGFFRQRGCLAEMSMELVSGVSPTPPQLEVDLAPQCR